MSDAVATVDCAGCGMALELDSEVPEHSLVVCEECSKERLDVLCAGCGTRLSLPRAFVGCDTKSYCNACVPPDAAPGKMLQ